MYAAAVGNDKGTHADAVVGEKQFKGGYPPKVLRSSLSKGVGKRPYKEIADYLTAQCDR